MFENLDRLNEAWAAFESVAKKLIVSGHPLSTARIGQNVRICYEGKPICECKAQEKIEATDHLGKFVIAYAIQKSAMNDNAIKAIAVVESAQREIEKLWDQAMKENS